MFRGRSYPAIEHSSVLRSATWMRLALQARTFLGGTMTGRFKALVVAASLAHGIVLFVLPRFPSYLADVTDLMKYGGHGVHVAMNHPIVLALYLVPFPAFVGLYLLRNWGRYLLLLSIALLGSFFFGVSVSGLPETFFGYAASLLDGAIIGLAFLSPLRDKFSKSSDVVDLKPVKRPRISLRTKLAIAAVFLGVALLGFFVGNPISYFRASEEQACRDRCAARRMSWRLVSQNPVGSVNQGGYDGPWRCECY